MGRRSTASSSSLSVEQQRDAEEAFECFDKTKSGYMASRELKVALRSLGFEPRKEEIAAMLKEYSDQGSKRVSKENFMALIASKMDVVDTREEIVKAFKLFDDDNTGHISLDNLSRVANELGEDITKDELKEMIEEADKDGDGQVSLDEFLKIMKKTNLY